MQLTDGFIFSENELTAIKISNIKDVTFDYLNGIRNLKINDIKMSDSVITDEIMKDVIKHIVDIIRFESSSNYKISDIITEVKRKKDLK